MPCRTARVGSAIGLHARPAAAIAEAATAFSSPIYLSMNGSSPTNAASALLVMLLGAGHDAEVTVTSDDPRAVDVIADLIAEAFDPQRQPAATP